MWPGTYPFTSFHFQFNARKRPPGCGDQTRVEAIKSAVQANSEAVLWAAYVVGIRQLLQALLKKGDAALEARQDVVAEVEALLQQIYRQHRERERKERRKHCDKSAGLSKPKTISIIRPRESMDSSDGFSGPSNAFYRQSLNFPEGGWMSPEE
jgi:hypothetical protein